MADKRINEFQTLSKNDFTSDDLFLIWEQDSGKTKNFPISMMTTRSARENQGFFSLLSNYYFTGGVATDTVIPTESIDTWITPDFTVDVGGLSDYRPNAMQEALADPFDDSTKTFSLEGLGLTGSCNFRASLSFDPDEDEGTVEGRLLFERHSTAVPSEDFSIENTALVMINGADVDYPAEFILPFFVGDTINTIGAGDSGKCTFQIKSSVAGTVSMRALTWFITS